jgi:hypothetical protein
MSNYRHTNRKFTLVLRTQDATAQTINLNGTNSMLAWSNVPWPSLIPQDIPPNSTFLCTHTFTESMGYGGIRDYSNTMRRPFALVSPMCAYSQFSQFTQQGTNNGLYTQGGYMNIMEEDIGEVINSGNAYAAAAGPFGADVDGYTSSARYHCKPKTFEVFAPENYRHLRIFFAELQDPPTLAQYTAPSPLYFGTNYQAGGIVLPAGQALLPQFGWLSPNGDGNTYTIRPWYIPQGAHVFEFELVEKISSDDIV